MKIDFQKARITTTVLLCIPILLLLTCQMGIFMFTLFPCSLILLLIHFFLGRERRKLNLRMNEWDNLKIFLGIGGLLLGLILWGLIAML